MTKMSSFKLLTILMITSTYCRNSYTCHALNGKGTNTTALEGSSLAVCSQLVYVILPAAKKSDSMFCVAV